MDRSAWKFVGVVAGFVVFGLFVSALLGAEEPSSPGDHREKPASTPVVKRVVYSVTYQVTTSKPSQDISLTYNNSDGNTEQQETRSEDGVWRKTFRIKPGGFAYLSVQNGEKSGSVECEIFLNGDVVEQAESSGAYVIASCSGIVR